MTRFTAVFRNRNAEAGACVAIERLHSFMKCHFYTKQIKIIEFFNCAIYPPKSAEYFLYWLMVITLKWRPVAFSFKDLVFFVW